jgi:hypothetical protein
MQNESSKDLRYGIFSKNGWLSFFDGKSLMWNLDKNNAMDFLSESGANAFIETMNQMNFKTSEFGVSIIF